MVQHKNLCKGVFAGLLMGFEALKRFSYQSIVYSDLYGQKLLKKTNGENQMAVTLKQFSEWEFKFPETILDARSVERTA